MIHLSMFKAERTFQTPLKSGPYFFLFFQLRQACFAPRSVMVALIAIHAFTYAIIFSSAVINTLVSIHKKYSYTL